jgi:hypothetical protein
MTPKSCRDVMAIMITRVSVSISVTDFGPEPATLLMSGWAFTDVHLSKYDRRYSSALHASQATYGINSRQSVLTWCSTMPSCRHVPAKHACLNAALQLQPGQHPGW